ncbi:MinD/ParA family protein [Rhodococcus sp. NPDC019627]|uniref:MinD/ParA family ATP-binding protein n=1 Tax=unclassified Rhodococcus (in: high G+C Gram-positive bacteria) TaxID=192944 RepID=UPI00340BFD65
MSSPARYEDSSTDDYAAENAVNLRTQRLKRQTPRPDPEPTGTRDDDTGDTTGIGAADDAYADPYAVGQDALAANEAPAADTAAPRPGGFLEPHTDQVIGPAVWGWRGKVNAATGLRIRPTPESAEMRFRDSIERIQQPLPGCSVVTFANPKGGAGKTPSLLTVSNTFGRHRGRGVVAWDANEATGTLGDRAARTTDNELGPWDVLEHASELASASAVSGALGNYLRLQPTLDEVLAADNSTTRERGIGWDECAALMAVLRRHRDLIFIDTGNNPLAANWLWAVEHSDLLVVPLPLRTDMAKQAYRMLDGLAARGLDELVRSALILTTATPESDPGLEASVLEEFGRLGVQNIIRGVPYEPQFASGNRIAYDRLAQTTIEAYTNIAAEIADLLAYRAQGRVQSLSDSSAPAQMQRPPEVPRLPPRYGRTDPYPPAPARYAPPGYDSPYDRAPRPEPFSGRGAPPHRRQ